MGKVGKNEGPMKREIEYPVKVTHLDLYKKESLRQLYSLIQLDRTYASFNDKFVTAITARKERINEVVGRIKTLGQKVTALENVNKKITISAAKNFPFQRGFTSDKTLHCDENYHPKAEELDPDYNNKIFGRRLIHEKNELEERVKMTTDDLGRLISFYKKFNNE